MILNSLDDRKKKLEDLFKRNLISNITNKDKFINLINEDKCVLYIGIDPTNDKYHIGHLVPYMLVLRLLNIGVKVVILVGGFTGTIGDPSFKNKERPPMTTDEVNKNSETLMEKLKYLFRNYHSNNSNNNITFVNNSQWLSKMSLKDFLNYTSYFSANKLLKMDHIKQRLDNELPLSFKEVCYSLLQAIDFHYLFVNNNVNVQIGGNDQWINLLNGVHLIKTIEEEEGVGLTVNLLLTSDGKKMGKTETGAVWADGSMDIYSFWQYFRNIADSEVKNFLYIFSMISIEEIHDMLETKDINECKIFLANSMVQMIYGENNNLQSILNNEDTPINVTSKSLVNLLVELDFTKTKAEAKRQIISGSIRINNEKIIEDILLIKSTEPIIVSCGKQKKKRIMII